MRLKRTTSEKYKRTFVMDGYRKGAATYDLERFPWEEGCIGQVEQERISAYLRHSSILECGIGTGRHALAFGNKYTYYGADLSREMIKVCREKASGLGLSIVLSDAECLPFRKGALDNIICSKSFKFFTSPVKFLAEARNSLRKGGRCIVTFEVLDSVWFRLIRKLGLKVPRHEKHYFTDEAVALFQKAGFSVVRMEPVANLFLGFHLFSWYILYPTPLSRLFRHAPSILSKLLVELDTRVRSRFLVLILAEA
jgi:ubiquinone/menaquinone biosynthesis C-methylase UbiE